MNTDSQHNTPCDQSDSQKPTVLKIAPDLNVGTKRKAVKTRAENSWHKITLTDLEGHKHAWLSYDYFHEMKAGGLFEEDMEYPKEWMEASRGTVKNPEEQVTIPFMRKIQDSIRFLLGVS